MSLQGSKKRERADGEGGLGSVCDPEAKRQAVEGELAGGLVIVIMRGQIDWMCGKLS